MHLPADGELTKLKKERKFSPRFWLGSDFFPWLRLLARGNFAFTPPHFHVGVCTSISAFAQMLLKFAQNARYGEAVRRTTVPEEPIFIIGHWRTGTTLLHELMIRDPRHSFLNTFQCLSPNSYLLTEKLFKKWLKFLLPERRPMDNMDVGWDRPQEDEFALCLLGQLSPYLDIIFPNRPPLAPGSLDLSGLSRHARQRWKRTFFRMVQTHTFIDPRRLILKSPPHSCRIETLLEIFPKARFVHIVRNPYSVFPSTLKLWKTLAEKHCVQTPCREQWEERVYDTFVHLYGRLREGRERLGPSQYHELKYEDLTQDPIGEMRRLYDTLQLGGFAEAQPHIAAYWRRYASYETNRFFLTPEQRQEITRRWGEVISYYGYPLDGGEQSLVTPPAAYFPQHATNGPKPFERAPVRKKASAEVSAVS